MLAKDHGQKCQKLRKMFRATKRFCRNWHINHLTPIPFIGLYMLVGAIFFWWSEREAELVAMAEKRELMAALRANHISAIESLFGPVDRQKQAKSVERVVGALFAKLEGYIDNGQGPPQWTFMTAMYFSGTLFTTIGYGDIACETTIGRIGTVIYSVIGIPLTLITLNELGKFLYKCINEFMASVSKQWQALLPFWCCCLRKWAKLQRAQSRKSTPILPKFSGSKNKEIERKTTHFFKDQRIAQRELVFDYDWKSIYGADWKGSQETVVEEGAENGGREAEEIEMENGTLLVRENSEKAKGPRNGPQQHQQQQQLGILGEQRPQQQQQQQLGILGEEAPRMHVLVAIFFTVSWLFFCAALFKHVEDWTYSESFYFVCISLLTVGLGDVKVSHREYMVLFFAFVMIGLSLVSMCINVIQNSIEDFYKRLLMQMLENGDPNSLRNNRLARFLLPLLSKEKKKLMMRQLQEDAQRSGMDIPTGFGDLDRMFDKVEDVQLQKESVLTLESLQQHPPEPTPPEVPELEIVLEMEPVEDQIVEGVEIGQEEPRMESLMVHWRDRRRESFQLEPKLMKLLPFIDKELKPEEEERRDYGNLGETLSRLGKLELHSISKLFNELVLSRLSGEREGAGETEEGWGSDAADGEEVGRDEEENKEEEEESGRSRKYNTN